MNLIVVHFAKISWNVVMNSAEFAHQWHKQCADPADPGDGAAAADGRVPDHGGEELRRVDVHDGEARRSHELSDEGQKHLQNEGTFWFKDYFFISKFSQLNWTDPSGCRWAFVAYFWQIVYLAQGTWAGVLAQPDESFCTKLVYGF